MPEIADVSVITIVRGRLDHLAMQQEALSRQPTPHERIIVQMGGPDVTEALGSHDVRVVDMPVDDGRLPLAAARNLGAAAASADVLVFLDVDCIPAPSLLARYDDALGRVGGLVAGPVSYLPAGATARGLRTPAEFDSMAAPHASRPAPSDGVLVREHRYELFWSLSFALRRGDWDRIGGFCESYRGYGGEDTDFAWTARRVGIPLHWVGGASAWHQHHHVESPPRQHLVDIVANSIVFHDRWGSWPMQGWLQSFRDSGLIDWTPDGDDLTLTSATRRLGAPSVVTDRSGRWLTRETSTPSPR